MTRVRVEPISCDQDSRKNDAFTLSDTLPTDAIELRLLPDFYVVSRCLKQRRK